MRIGDFDAARRNYDHRNGPSLFAEAKQAVKVGDTRPNWRMEIGGKNVTNSLISCEVTHDAEGDSGMTFSVGRQLPLEQLDNRVSNPRR